MVEEPTPTLLDMIIPEVCESSALSLGFSLGRNEHKQRHLFIYLGYFALKFHLHK